MTKKTRQDTLDQLCQLGYDASPANGDCFDIRQGGYTHYLNGEEAKALSLASLNHPVDLRDYASRQGLNLWYSFDCGISGHTIFFRDVEMGRIIEAKHGPVCWSSEPQWTFKIGMDSGCNTRIRDFRRPENGASHWTSNKQQTGDRGMHLDQMDLVAAADTIVAEFGRDEIKAAPGIGIEAWRQTDHVGASSDFMAARIGAAGSRKYAHPNDPADFGRCLSLLAAAPELRERLPEMARESPQWAALVSHRDELESLYREEEPSGQAPKLYDRMRELLQESERVIE